MRIVIHHNPNCGTSRVALWLIEAAGYHPIIVEYVKTGWTRHYLQALFAAADLSARDALRTSKTPAQALGLLDEGVSEDQLLAAMVEHPILVNRPIVCTPRGVRLCRPSEQVLDLLDKMPPGPFVREDGSLIIGEDGERLA